MYVKYIRVSAHSSGGGRTGVGIGNKGVREEP